MVWTVESRRKRADSYSCHTQSAVVCCFVHTIFRLYVSRRLYSQPFSLCLHLVDFLSPNGSVTVCSHLCKHPKSEQIKSMNDM